MTGIHLLTNVFTAGSKSLDGLTRHTWLLWSLLCPAPQKTLAFNMAPPLSFLPLYWFSTKNHLYCLKLSPDSVTNCHHGNSKLERDCTQDRLEGLCSGVLIAIFIIIITRIPRNAETSDSFYFSGIQRGQQYLNIT